MGLIVGRTDGLFDKRVRERIEITDLDPPEIRIQPVSVKQSLVSSRLDDPTVVENDDGVGGSNRGEAVGDGESLPLAPGKFHAAFPDDGVESILQRSDELPRAGLFERGDDRLATRFRNAIRDVFTDRTSEQKRFLRDVPEVIPKAPDGDVLDVVAIETDRALVSVVEPHQ